MYKHLTTIVTVAVLASAILSAGCVQMPTEKQSISDMRPQISFKVDEEQGHGFRVLVDGLDIGAASDFIDGKAAARVLPGTHVVSVTSGGSVLLEERIYLGDGVSRSFIVK